jgi:hypothetical protein
LDTWKPASAEEVEAIVEEGLKDCTPEKQEIFRRFRVPLRHAPIERYGKLEYVFIVAQRENEALYWEDVEEGFNFSPVDDSGRILEHWCNQDDLCQALTHWLPNPPPAYWLGPAIPVK